MSKRIRPKAALTPKQLELARYHSPAFAERHQLAIDLLGRGELGSIQLVRASSCALRYTDGTAADVPFERLALAGVRPHPLSFGGSRSPEKWNLIKLVSVIKAIGDELDATSADLLIADSRHTGCARASELLSKAINVLCSAFQVDEWHPGGFGMADNLCDVGSFRSAVDADAIAKVMKLLAATVKGGE